MGANYNMSRRNCGKTNEQLNDPLVTKAVALKMDEFNTTRKLMGKVISLSEGVVKYYE